MRNTARMALACVAILLFADRASASITYVWSGMVVGAATDIYGLYGPSGASLSGQSYTATYVFEPTLLTSLGTGTSDVTLHGGPTWGTPSTGSASLEIGGVLRPMVDPRRNTAIVSQYRWSPTTPPLYTLATAFIAGGGIGFALEGYLQIEAHDVPAGELPLDLAEAYSGNPCSTGYCVGEFRYSPDGTSNSAEIFALSVNHLTVSSDLGTTLPGGDPSKVPIPGVPEPTTWALLISGFGMAGAMLRRRRAAMAAWSRK